MGLKTVIAIIGTTGVGKTKLSIELAQKLKTEIINVDAMQMYKGFDIITNKANSLERELIPHHLMDFVDISKEYTIKDFELDALKKIDELHKLEKIPILVGGTHYYLQSLLYQSSLIPATTKLVQMEDDNELFDLKKESNLSSIEEKPSILDTLNTKWEQLSNIKLHEELVKVDPIMANHWHINDRRKVLRSLGIYYQTGKCQSQFINEQKDLKKLRFNVIYFWVYSDQKVLNERLDSRVDVMVENGLFNELEELRSILSNLPGDKNDYERGIKQAIGFKAFDPYLTELSLNQPDITQLEKIKLQCLEVMKQQTRRYAKKQIYWIKNQLLPLYFNSPQLNTTQPITDLDFKSKLYLLDGTDINNWDIEVGKKGLDIITDILNKNIILDPLTINEVSKSLLEDPKDLRKEPVIATWVKRTCEQCSLRIDKKTGQLVSPVIVNGDREWEIHIKSKGHRKQSQYNKFKALTIIQSNPLIDLDQN